MIIRLDPASPTPLYAQLLEQLKRWIATGQLQPGERLPAVRDLAASCGINRNTAARAIRQLGRSGFVEARAGRGTVVVDAIPRADASSREAFVEAAIDRLLVDSHSLGIPFEELSWRLSKRIDTFRRRETGS